MIGAIAGDIIGSVYEWHNIKTTEFPQFQKECFFTDDTVLTVALAESILTGESYEKLMRQYFERYPDAGYGENFIQWAESENPSPYKSWGNGAAMRISPVGWAYNRLDEVLLKAAEYTAITHDHPEGIKGGMSVGAAIYLARTGATKNDIRHYTTGVFEYDLSKTCDQIRPDYSFDVSCKGTVPQAFTAFLESTDFESAIRLAVSLGGDTDTLACITGSIAEAFYGIPESIRLKTVSYLDESFACVVDNFVEKYVK